MASGRKILFCSMRLLLEIKIYNFNGSKGHRPYSTISSKQIKLKVRLLVNKYDANLYVNLTSYRILEKTNICKSNYLLVTAKPDT